MSAARENWDVLLREDSIGQPSSSPRTRDEQHSTRQSEIQHRHLVPRKAAGLLVIDLVGATIRDRWGAARPLVFLFTRPLFCDLGMARAILTFRWFPNGRLLMQATLVAWKRLQFNANGMCGNNVFSVVNPGITLPSLTTRERKRGEMKRRCPAMPVTLPDDDDLHREILRVGSYELLEVSTWFLNDFRAGRI